MMQKMMVDQRATVYVKTFEWDLGRLLGKRLISAEDLDELRRLVDAKLKRTAEMINLLSARGMYCYFDGRGIVLESCELAADEISLLLKEGGFLGEEYFIKLEYSRKWGIL